MNFRAHTRNTRQSTDRITQSGFSNCPCNCIFTPSAACDGRGRSGNSNVCSLRSHSMSFQHILLLTPGRPVLYTTTRALFPVLLPTSPTAGDVCKEFKKTGQFVSDLQICCHFTTQNSKTDIKTNGETNTFPICLFVWRINLLVCRSSFLDLQ